MLETAFKYKTILLICAYGVLATPKPRFSTIASFTYGRRECASATWSSGLRNLEVDQRLLHSVGVIRVERSSFVGGSS